MEKRIILSYQRTGSTPVLDVYRKFQESYYPSAIRVPQEPTCRDTWKHPYDFDMVENPYKEFKEKYSLSEAMRYLLHLPEGMYAVERQKVGAKIFSCILKEDVYVTKMFPEQFVGNELYNLKLLKQATDDKAKIIVLYRKNLLDSLSSLLLAIEEDKWVVNKSWKDVRKRLYLTESTKYPKEVLEWEVTKYVNNLHAWYNFVVMLKEAGVPLTLVAYEDITSYDYQLLNKLEGTKFLSGYNTCLIVQSDPRDRTNALFWEKDIIEKAIKYCKEHLPVNEMLQLELPL